MMSQAPQFLIHHRDQLLERSFIALAPGKKQSGDLIRHGG
jgi:hypothetical protein